MVTLTDAIYYLAITNLIGLVLVLLTCRCLYGLTTQNKFLALLNKYHCWIWWLFLTSVALHATIALYQRLA